VSIYATWTDAEITAELTRLKADHKSLITKWQAGDTTVEKERGRVESQLQQLNQEIIRRPDLADLVARAPVTRTRCTFS
jgi:hypothetical protein